MPDKRFFKTNKKLKETLATILSEKEIEDIIYELCYAKNISSLFVHIACQL